MVHDEIDVRVIAKGGWFNVDLTLKGIYELDGDVLKLCVGIEDKRPTEFTGW